VLQLRSDENAFLSFEMTEALHPLHLEPAGLGGERET
jgi:hypothetical protein